MLLTTCFARLLIKALFTKDMEGVYRLSIKQGHKCNALSSRQSLTLPKAKLIH